MDLDRDLLQRAKGRDRSEDLDDPGRRTNTDRMPPTAAAANGMYRKPSPLAGKHGDPETAPATFKLDHSDENLKAAKKREKHTGHEKKDQANTKAAPAPKAAYPTKSAKDSADANETKETKDAKSAKDSHGETKHDKDAKATKAGGHGEAHVGGRGGTAGSGAAPNHHASPAAAAAGTFTSTTVSEAAGARDRTTVAVGEEVDFHATSAGAWTASASIDTASHTGETFRWKAPDQAGPVTITFTPTGGGAAQTKQMTVIAPSAMGLTFRKLNDDPQPPAGVGMWTNLSFGPQTVDFYNAQWLEVPGEAENLSGYFEQLHLQEGRELDHKPNKDWTAMSEPGVFNHDVDDHAYINSLPPLTRTIVDFFGTRSYFPGSFQWTVPNKYRVKDHGEGQVFTNITQSFSIDAQGTTTVSKGGQSATQASDGVAAAEGMVLPRFATVDDAQRALIQRAGTAAGQVILGLQKLSTYRTRDPESYQNLVTALNRYSNVKLYVAVRNLNTYSVWGADDFAMTINGTGSWTQNFSVNTDHYRDFYIDWTTLINPNTFGSTGTLRYNLNINSGDHELHASMGLPFNDYGAGVVLPGSDNRIKLTSFFRAQD